MSDLKELYQELILDHGRHPRCFGELDCASVSKEGYNPVCGDRLCLYLQVDNDQVVDASFNGEGCAISVASASLMVQAIKGLAVTDAKQLFEDFQQMLMSDQDEVDLGKLNALSGVKQFPMRVKCVTLAWHTLKAALENDQQQVSTE